MTTNNGSDNREGTTHSVSRRGFLIATGAGVTVGLSASPASARRSELRSGTVAIDGSPTQRELARGIGKRIERRRSDVTVSVSTSGTTAGARRFATGDIDVLAGSRPLLSAERERANANGVEYASREVPVERIMLRHSTAPWHDCLSKGQLAEAWATDGAVETWAEVSETDENGAVTTDQPAEIPSGVANLVRRTRKPPMNRGGTVLVRGRRAYQYATGFGGVGYYEPTDEELVRSDSTEKSGTHTPLVRLVSISVNRDSIKRPAVREFVDTYAAMTGAVVGDEAYFADSRRNTAR